MGGYQDHELPLPSPRDQAHIPQEVGAFGHPATRGLSEFHFLLELDSNMDDHNGLFWVMQRIGAAIDDLAEDRMLPLEWQRRPTKSAVSSFDWAARFDRNSWQHATLLL